MRSQIGQQTVSGGAPASPLCCLVMCELPECLDEPGLLVAVAFPLAPPRSALLSVGLWGGLGGCVLSLLSSPAVSPLMLMLHSSHTASSSPNSLWVWDEV